MKYIFAILVIACAVAAANAREEVEYNVEQGPHGRPKAFDVTGPNGAPLKGGSRRDDRFSGDREGGRGGGLRGGRPYRADGFRGSRGGGRDGESRGGGGRRDDEFKGMPPRARPMGRGMPARPGRPMSQQPMGMGGMGMNYGMGMDNGMVNSERSRLLGRGGPRGRGRGGRARGRPY